ADRDPEIVSRDVLQFVGFVEDDRGGVRKNSGIRGTVGLQLDGEIGKEEVMVDDDDVALHGPAAHFGDETALPLAAFLADAGVGASVEFVPELAGFRELGEFGAIASGGVLFPYGDGSVLFDLLQAAEDRLIGQVVELFPAEIVVAAFHVADGEFCGLDGARSCPYVDWGEGLLQEGDVLVEELLLQILCPGGDDYALTGTDHG